MGTIFISYRREEAAGEARALFNDLVARIGKDLVFMDVDTIALGRDFRQVLQENLASCDLMLVLIGKDWIEAKDRSGRRRLEDSGDFVRLEIGAALKRNIPVTPVLLQGAHMPSPEQLPEDLRDLSYRNGFELSHTRWDSDVQEMIKRLRLGSQLRRNTLSDKLPEVSLHAPARSRWALVLAIALVAGGLLYYINQHPPKANATVPSPASAPVRRERTAERLAEPSSPIEGPNNSIERARQIVEGTTVRGSRIADQDLYFYRFAASSTKTRVVLRKLSARGFRGGVDVYDHAENRVAGQTEAVALLGLQNEPVTFSFQSTLGENYYIRVTIDTPAAEYELTVREE
jgi:TIR domain-containing protein